MSAAPPPAAPRVLRFDDFELDVQTLELRRGGAPVKLQQQPARVLAVLAAAPGELVTREALREAIWGADAYVDFEQGLNYCVRQIRAALGDSAEAPRYLETLRGRGYRFLAPPAAATPVAVAPRTKWWVVAATALALVVVAASAWGMARWIGDGPRMRAAIGVAPITAPPGEQAWAAALRTQLVSRLAIASRLPVVDLGAGGAPSPRARWRLEGRVDRDRDVYRVTLLLRDLRDGTVAWSDVFTGTPGDWIDAQSAMADRMTEIVRYRVEGPAAGQPHKRAFLPSRLPASH